MVVEPPRSSLRALVRGHRSESGLAGCLGATEDAIVVVSDYSQFAR